MNAPGKNGFTIVELLVVAAIVGILMSLISVYFSQQAKVTRETQARQEARIKARMVAELVVQDLQTAGSSVVFNNGNTDEVQINCSASSVKRCISSSNKGIGIKDQVSVVYATSLRPDEPCREVDYDFKPKTNTWRRSEVACGKTINHQPLADNIVSLNITYTCADDSIVGDPVKCYEGAAGFPRQATVTVQARADDLGTVTSDMELTTALPNLRY